MTFQKTVKLGEHLERRMADLSSRIAKMDLAVHPMLAGLTDTQLTRLALSFGIDALVREHGLGDGC